MAAKRGTIGNVVKRMGMPVRSLKIAFSPPTGYDSIRNFRNRVKTANLCNNFRTLGLFTFNLTSGGLLRFLSLSLVSS